MDGYGSYAKKGIWIWCFLLELYRRNPSFESYRDRTQGCYALKFYRVFDLWVVYIFILILIFLGDHNICRRRRFQSCYKKVTFALVGRNSTFGVLWFYLGVLCKSFPTFWFWHSSFRTFFSEFATMFILSSRFCWLLLYVMCA